MSEIESSTVRTSVGTAPAADSLPSAPRIDRPDAVRRLTEARRLYDIAGWVHSRRLVGGTDSAVFAHRALAVLFELLVRLHGEDPPSDFGELTERAQRTATKENLLEEELVQDASVIREMRDRFLGSNDGITPAEDRRYDRAFVRSADWLRVVQTYLDERLPGSNRPLTRNLIIGASIVAALAIGFVAGSNMGGEAQPVKAGAAPKPSAGEAGPTLAVTFYGDPEFRTQLLTRRDPNIAFDWGSEPPAGSVPGDHFSARWEGRLGVESPGKYTFYLTSDDGSRLFLDNALVVDNWGGHAAVTKVGTVELGKGAHPLRVEYFDEIGTALVRLEWSSEHFAQRLVMQSDLR